MSWWLWCIATLGGILAVVLVVAWSYSRKFHDGLVALMKSAHDVMERSAAVVNAEVFGGPMVDGARMLRLQDQASARSDLREAVRHTRFGLWKTIEKHLAAQVGELTETQRTLLENDAGRTVEIALGRAYFSGFQLGLVFAIEGYWGPFAAEIGLAPPHSRKEADERLAKLDRYHPWVRPMVLEVTAVLADESLVMLADQVAAQAGETLDKARWTTANEAPLKEALTDVCQQGVLHGVAKGLLHASAPDTPQPPPSVTNGHP